MNKYVSWGYVSRDNAPIIDSNDGRSISRNLASLNILLFDVINLLYYYFGICYSELARLVPLPFSWGRSIRYSDRLHDFSVTIPRSYMDVYVNSFFLHTARLWNSLPIERLPLTYDLNSFKSRIHRHLLTVGSSKQISCVP